MRRVRFHEAKNGKQITLLNDRFDCRHSPSLSWIPAAGVEPFFDYVNLGLAGC